MPLDVPFRLGPFEVDEAGRLQAHSPDRLPVFQVAWRERTIHVCLDGGPDDGRLALHAILGRIPSSAASDAAGRTEAFTLLRTLAGAVPAGWSVQLLADHRIDLRAERHLAMPATVTDLVAEVALFLLALAPYLDLIADDSAPALEPAGMEKTCPG